ncbi:Golgi-associated plant pathogenesis-related protein 1-like [Ixodes scapularis]|uniref:Golgi-associated plant pathogenesis-related protein 1-like n=1 Tax=Ixodes scapularis TaxID=6945 RepID=UPI001C382411|nr:Golgi-associated plant pathogenesis-related protein 1-like [Ixodes scapularis]
MSTTLHIFIFAAIMLFIISEGAGDKPPKKKSHQKTPRPKDEYQIFNKLCIEEHNKYRKRHHVPPLKSDSTLYLKARAWANRLARTGDVRHETLRGIGENIYWMTLAQQPYSQYAAEAVQLWYDENKLYDYQRGGFSPSTAHYTQLVWKSTTHVGCGYAVSRSQTCFVVCKYSPQGNIPDEYQRNVLRP